MIIAGETVVFRPMEAGDLNYVLATWLRSMRDLIPRKLVPDDVFFRRARPIVEEFTHSGWAVVACSDNSAGTIYGWGIKHADVVLYVYVMGALRGRGLGKAIGEALRS